MKRKSPIDEKEAIDKREGTFDSLSFAVEPDAEPAEKHDIFAMINGYENEAREVLKAGGYPLTIKELLGRPQKERRIRDIMRMFTHFREVRIRIGLKDAAGAALCMAYGVRAAMLSRIRPAQPLIEIGKSRSGHQKVTRGKRRTWNGLTQAEIEARDENIYQLFKEARLKNSHLKPHGYAVKNQKKHKLSVKTLTTIITSKLGN